MRTLWRVELIQIFDTLFSYKDYEDHMETHEVACPQCAKIVFGLRSLRRHISLEHKKEDIKG
jgi:hypothetical protein